MGGRGVKCFWLSAPSNELKGARSFFLDHVILSTQHTLLVGGKSLLTQDLLFRKNVYFQHLSLAYNPREFQSSGFTLLCVCKTHYSTPPLKFQCHHTPLKKALELFLPSPFALWELPSLLSSWVIHSVGWWLGEHSFPLRILDTAPTISAVPGTQQPNKVGGWGEALKCMPWTSATTEQMKQLHLFMCLLEGYAQWGLGLTLLCSEVTLGGSLGNMLCQGWIAGLLHAIPVPNSLNPIFGLQLHLSCTTNTLGFNRNKTGQ